MNRKGRRGFGRQGWGGVCDGSKRISMELGSSIAQKHHRSVTALGR